MQRSYIHVRFPFFYTSDGATHRKVCVNQGSKVFVSGIAVAPQMMESHQSPAGQSESTPDPMGFWFRLLHLHLKHRAFRITADSVEQLRAIDWEQKERKLRRG